MICSCKMPRHGSKLVVLTGGPGAGKTAVLEVVRRRFCEHVAVLPEAASILFGGGMLASALCSGRFSTSSVSSRRWSRTKVVPP